MFEYLDELQASGETNMFSSPMYLTEEYDNLDMDSAKKVVMAWMKNFN